MKTTYTTSNLEKNTNLESFIPKAIQLEKSVLGALLLEQDALAEVIDILKPNHFYHPAHKEIYNTITSLFQLAEHADLLTIANRLRKNGTLEQVGGPAYLTELTENIGSASHIETHAHIIIQYAIRRDLIQKATEIKTQAKDETKDILDLLNESQQSLFSIAEGNIRKNYTSISTLLTETLRDLEACKNQNTISGIPSGFPALDRVTLGWQNSDFIVIAGRPGMGKTSFALSILSHAAIKKNTPVALFSLEMSEEQITKRLIAMESGLENQKLKKKQLKPYEWQQLYHKTTDLSQAPIYIDGTPALTPVELRAKCKRLVAKQQVKLIIIDYLQLMQANGPNREQQMSTISRTIKAIAKEINIPIISLAQLSRAVEIRGGDKRPQLSDLRESGAIEQDADLVIFPYRPGYYGITEEESGKSLKGYTEIIVAKHRNGPLGTVPLTYLPATTQFIPFDETTQQPTEIVAMPF